MRALILRHDRLGDLILTTPLVRAVSMAGYDVDVVARRSFLEVFANSPRVVNAYAIEDVAGPDFPGKWLPLSRWMRKQKYDLSIVALAQPKEVAFASLAGGAKKRVALYGGKWARLTLHRVVPSSILGSDGVHYSDKLLACLPAIGIRPSGSVPELHLLDSERNWAAQQLAGHFAEGSTTIIVHPGSGAMAYGFSPSTCNLPMCEYERFCRDVLDKTGWNVILTGNQAERARIEEWSHDLLANPRIWLAAGSLTIRELSALIASVKLVVVASSAPLHLASATGTPTVSPFCPGFGVSAGCWGNLGSKGVVVEPASCPRLKNSGALCGDFEGKLTGRTLFEQMIRSFGALEVVSARPPSQAAGGAAWNRRI